ncbi:hypothetical protein ACL02O_11285 [Micromonospora sp. MS34]|uniref:hypothetical protein n=1 Tax=Micromonospora sp. MS34 TaxID=3385971 RepID=UPI0039A0E730
MPAPVSPTEKRAPLLTVLFWIGVALAPLAALILLVADGNGALRFGAVLAILAVVLIGLSVALRADSGGTAGVEQLQDQIEQLRRELRSEIVAAAQRGNQALDQAQQTREQVGALRRRLDAAAAAAGLSGAPAEEPSAARARVAAPEPHDDRYDRSDQGGSSWGQPAGERRGEERSARRSQPGTRYGAARAGGADRPLAGVYGAPRTSEPEARPEPAPRQVGVVHHTETVHVTTRHTIMDGSADAGTGNRYGGYAGRRSPDERGHGGAEPEERSWSGYRGADDDRGWSGADRSRAGQGDAWDDRSWAGQGDDRPWAGQGGAREEWGRTGQDGDRFRPSGAAARDHSWAGTGEVGASGGDRGWSAEPGEQQSWSSPAGPADGRPWDEPGDDRSRSAERDEPGRAGQDAGGWASAYARAWAPAESSGSAGDPDDEDSAYWSELRSGNRWAALRDDEHGREIRLGERRSAVHADGGGTEYRVEDRWASVRAPRGEQGGVHGAGGPGDWAEEGRPALPAGGVPVPGEWRPPTQRSGQPEWRQVDPEPVRYGDERYGYPPRDDVPRAGGAGSADRWR